MKFADVQGCPVPAKLAPFVRRLIAETGVSLQSAYRGNDPNGVRILKKHGKHSQAYLYNSWVNRRPGFLPANPPGRSTHELRNDGVAYPKVPVGGKLPWWACGLDFDDAHITKLIVAANKHGWKLAHFYSASSEFHHLNFRRPPLRYRVKRLLGFA